MKLLFADLCRLELEQIRLASGQVRRPGRTDSDGIVKDRLGSEPGVALSDVSIDPARKVAPAPRAHGSARAQSRDVANAPGV
jgi:hypothetical protein